MIVGPSYSLQTRKAAVQRALNYMLRSVEPGNEKGGFFLQQTPGLTLFASLGAEVRGGLNVGGRCFVVAGALLYEVAANGVATLRGTLSTSTGAVDMAVGVLQLVIVDGANGYVLTLASNVFGKITDPDFYGSPRVGYVDGFFVFVRPGTQQFYISAIDNANDLDALDFASAESSPDLLISLVVTQREVWLMGAVTTEVWFNAGSAFPFARVQGATLEVGCLAPQSAQKLDNTVIWLGRDANGVGMVWRAEGYQPRRISTHAVEETLRASTGIESATAYCYQQDGQSFYCLNAPGLDTTWVYDASVGQWHERAESVAGVLAPHRALAHVHAHGRNLVGDAVGKLYAFDPDKNTNDGDVLYRERTSPHEAAPNRARVMFEKLRLDVEVGQTGQGVTPVIELQWSNDGGFTWGNWLARSLGEVGQYAQPVVWHRLGQARDRVWRIRCTDDARASIVNAAVTVSEGA